MIDDKKIQEKFQVSVNSIEKLTKAELAIKDSGWRTSEKVETCLLESANEAKTSTERFDFFETAAEMRRKLIDRFV